LSEVPFLSGGIFSFHEIVLMHVGSNPDDGTTFDADALHAMIEQMRRVGYRFVTLDALLS